MQVKSIETAIINIIQNLTGIARKKVTPQSTFQSDLNMDSLDQMEMCMEIEDELQVCISDKEALAFETVQQVIDKVTQLREEANA